MSTRSVIGYVTPDNHILFVYCHFDGYLSGVGKTLLEHYNTIERVVELVSNGAISSLGPHCDKPEGHSFTTPKKGYTVYYGRDRGEVGCRIPQRCFSHHGMQTEQYQYLFKEGKWFYRKPDIQVAFHELAPELESS